MVNTKVNLSAPVKNFSKQPFTSKAVASVNKYGKASQKSSVVMSSSSAALTSDSFGMMSPPVPQAPGILDQLFGPGSTDGASSGQDSVWDRITDPSGTKKEEAERVRAKKVNELFGGGKTAISTLDRSKETENILKNKPQMGFNA
jgi:hypothetical protein